MTKRVAKEERTASIESRRARVKSYVAEHPAASDEEIGRALGIARRTAARDLASVRGPLRNRPTNTPRGRKPAPAPVAEAPALSSEAREQSFDSVLADLGTLAAEARAAGNAVLEAKIQQLIIAALKSRPDPTETKKIEAARDQRISDTLEKVAIGCAIEIAAGRELPPNSAPVAELLYDCLLIASRRIPPEILAAGNVAGEAPAT